MGKGINNTLSLYKVVGSLVLYLISIVGYAQIPAGYYNTATGTGYTLKTQLHNIINGHTPVTYADLWTAYGNTDIDPSDGYIYDMYSENPAGTDPYNYVLSSDQCGTYTIEGDCYNREHSFPRSWFGGAIDPMNTDIHHIVPTDGRVNGWRSSFVYGETNSPSITTQNGSKLGPARAGLGYSGTVFEPIDAYKGDFARIYFYMATRYEDIISGWPGSAMLDGSSNQVFSNWAITMLLDWHNNDPVSQKEIDRNNDIYYQVQNNRNPFVDNPSWVNAIWGGCSVGVPSTTSNSRCGTGSITLTSSPGSGGTTSRWYTSSTGGTHFYTGNSYTFSLSGTTTYYVSSYDGSSCESSRVPVTATMNSLPAVSFSGLASNYQVSDPSVTLTGSPSGGTFTGTGVSGNTFNPGVGIGSYNITYTYTDGNGCTNSQTRAVTVSAASTSGTASSDLIISGVYDGPLTGGHPKGVEFYVVNDISDLSIYGFGSANNGGGTDGEEFTFPSISKASGDFIYVATDSAGFRDFLGFNADYIDIAAAINGDDAIELFKNSSVIDVFGDINVDGTGQPWEYLDGWAFRKDCTGPDSITFDIANWTFSGINVLDGETLNSTAATPIPIGTYTCTQTCTPTFSTDIVSACGSYTWINSTTYTSSNNTATHVLTNAAGCDSTVTLNLTINSPTSSTDVVSACGSYTWINSTTYTSSNNTATHVLTNAAGCDSTITLNLTINSPTSSTDVVSACGSYTWINSTTYTSSNNTATHVLTNAAGCDSIVTLNLTINSPTSSTDVVSACGSYTWINSTTYTSSNNTATHVLTNAAGCDSTITLNLTINSPTSSTDVVSACGSYTWINGTTYTSSNNTATHVLTNAAGCDSIVTLNLTISNSINTSESISACGSAVINGNTYTASQAVVDMFTSIYGCDSIHTTNLTILGEVIANENMSGCGEVIVNGNSYTSSQIVYDTISGGALSGCDSITIINITVNSNSNSSIIMEECDSYMFNGVTYTTSTIINDTLVGANQNGCDSIIQLDLTINYSNTTNINDTISEGDSILINGVYIHTSGIYYDTLLMVNNCDSIVAYILVVSDPNSILSHSANEYLNVYPVPFSETLNFKYISLDKKNVVIEIFDLTGKKVIEKNLSYNPSGEYQLNFSEGKLLSGVYLMKIENYITTKIIKE